MRSVRIIAVINQKGGVGKTTTVANLGAAVAARGRRVLLIDLDPQAHLTLHLGIEPAAADRTVYDVLAGDAPLESAVVPIADGLRLVPSVIDLAAAEIELVSTVGREQILRDRFAAMADEGEWVFIDCPPSLGLLTLNALAAADEVLIPLQPHFLALQGLGKLLETVSLVQQRINPRLRVSGVVLCMYESATRLAAEVVADLREFFDAGREQDTPWAQARIFDTVIRRNVKLAESPSHGQTIFDYDPGSNGARDYAALTEEFLAGPATPEAAASSDSPIDAVPTPDVLPAPVAEDAPPVEPDAVHEPPVADAPPAEVDAAPPPADTPPAL